MPPRVLVSGYYGFHNAGDEAILHALTRALRRAVPGVEITVLSADPEHTARTDGVAAVPRGGGAAAAAMRRTDLFISGGGGLLQDTTSLKSLAYYLGLIALARALRKKVFFYAQGIGPLRTAAGRALVRLVADRATLITVRDQDSREELCGLGIRRPPVIVTADPVLGLVPEPDWTAAGREILGGLGLGEGPVAGISVRAWPGQDGYLETIAGVCDQLAANGWRVVLLPFHHPADLEMSRRVAELCRAPAAVVEQRLEFRELLGVTAHLGLAVGMRLHFLIFAAVCGLAPVGLVYDPKVGRFLDRLGLPPEACVTRPEPQALARAVDLALANRDAWQNRVRERVPALAAEAERTAELVRDLL
ncbi:MAG: polysaccharide pyruvyl transferase CsaB [Bacillota bacterium]|nr:polysaccharide pyruvyl transferase CsaB [Bacillota bacterium]